jgi:CYTH domain-containing protein
MIEKEKKYLLKYIPQGCSKVEIEQGYLMIEGRNHLRIRIEDGTKASIAFKRCVTESIKHEYEYEIPISDGIELMSSIKCKLKKTRYKTTHNGNTIDIDDYGNGIWVAEIEFNCDESQLKVPDYFGKDVTGIKEYSNISMALSNA